MAVYTTIDDPSAHFQIALYTGDAVSGKAVTNAGNSDLQPDIIWIKNRSNTHDWVYQDSTMGLGNRLTINTQDDLESSTNYVKTFTSDGFTVGTEGAVNASSNGSYAAFQWKVQGGTRTTFNESGDNPGGGRQVNATAGLSMIDYTGTGGAGTLAHGLGVAPNFIITKGRSVGEHWTVTMMNVANSPIDETDRIKLDVAETAQDNSVYWNDTAATSTNVTVGSGDATNKDGDTFIMYAFANIKGFSKAGHYKGNGSADGPFINLGFRPAWVMVKQTTTANRDWRIIDAARSPFNLADDEIHPNDNNAVTTTGMQLNLTANGFKIKTTSTACNSNGHSYIFLAFAQHPFVTSSGVPVGAK